MPPLRIIEALNVIEHVCLCLVPGPVRLAVDALRLERGEEALHRRVVPDVARAAHRAGDAMIGHQPLEPRGRSPPDRQFSGAATSSFA